jgi:hypothetical protein
MAGGCQVPSPGGKIEGGSVFGEYRRITDAHFTSSISLGRQVLSKNDSSGL